MMNTEQFLLNYKQKNIKKFCRGEACTTYLAEHTNKTEFENYIAGLRNNSCELFDVRTIRDNIFYTFFHKNIQIHAYYTGHDKRTHIIIDENTEKYERSITYAGDGDTVVYQFELDYRNIDCGMCYIIQCRDGSFFMIDSAHMFSENDHLRLHEFLKRHTEKGSPIVISGWFLSHGHQDHIVKFMDFVKEDFQDVILQNIYYNFPVLTVKGAQKWKEDDKKTMREFWEFMREHKELKSFCPHTGQRFCAANLAFTVLSTHEDLCLYPLECYNDASAVIMLEAENTKILFLGDANYTACSEMTARYGRTLKADIVQVAHHGFNEANAGIYYMIEADTALYATSQERFMKHASSPSNSAVLSLSKEFFVAGNGTTGFCLPYKAGTARQFPKEITE